MSWSFLGLKEVGYGSEEKTKKHDQNEVLKSWKQSTCAFRVSSCFLNCKSNKWADSPCLILPEIHLVTFFLVWKSKVWAFWPERCTVADSAAAVRKLQWRLADTFWWFVFRSSHPLSVELANSGILMDFVDLRLRVVRNFCMWRFNDLALRTVSAGEHGVFLEGLQLRLRDSVFGQETLILDMFIFRRLRDAVWNGPATVAWDVQPDCCWTGSQSCSTVGHNGSSTEECCLLIGRTVATNLD